MSFNSFSEFMAMGGHGLYVWLSYGLGLAVILINVILPRLQRNRLLAEQKRRLRREEGVR
ncbi:heme exporter protein CcmD [Marinobacterium sp. AK62]|uniref:Heme exporter protein D n=1 Tax=Marinobacterium alkalitolerans TaxID=1542925 RepID=A0ABS3ZE86_9GAMM|nr:heme exporter protein CcmD [Marinobacterium alkalitolerans]MBP0049989.1 heme exporter protein CcmD [Marinobacterium alkalitolerans]